MHNTGFFPDCYLLSVTDWSISIPYHARYSEIFKKPNFQPVKWKYTFIRKMLSQAELEIEGSRLATIFGSPPTPHQTHMVALPQTHFLGGKFHFRRIPRDYRENYRNSSEKAGIPANSFSTRERRSEGKPVRRDKVWQDFEKHRTAGASDIVKAESSVEDWPCFYSSLPSGQ